MKRGRCSVLETGTEKELGECDRKYSLAAAVATRAGLVGVKSIFAVVYRYFPDMNTGDRGCCRRMLGLTKFAPLDLLALLETKLERCMWTTFAFCCFF